MPPMLARCIPDGDKTRLMPRDTAPPDQQIWRYGFHEKPNDTSEMVDVGGYLCLARPVTAALHGLRVAIWNKRSHDLCRHEPDHVGEAGSVDSLSI
jgi:hypothetical protein